jgi:transcription initiation factor TFIIF subunit beta
MDRREEERLLEKRIFEADNNKQKVQIIGRTQASNVLQVGTSQAAAWGGNFIVSLDPIFMLLYLA